MPDPKKFSELRSGKGNFFAFWGVRGMLRRKLFKIKGLRLAKNAFPELF